MARKSSRDKKRPEALTYTHLMIAEKKKESRRKLKRQEKKKLSDRQLKLKKKAAIVKLKMKAGKTAAAKD